MAHEASLAMQKALAGHDRVELKLLVPMEYHGDRAAGETVHVTPEFLIGKLREAGGPGVGSVPFEVVDPRLSKALHDIMERGS